MLKILLVYDDFQELTSIELMLKKIGFDVVGITSEFSLAEQLLSFNPQIVVAQGRTAKVSTANVGRRLRESARWDGQSVLVFYPNAKPQAIELLKIRMDVGLEYPVEPTKLVQVLAQLGSLDSNQLLDKLIKSMAQEASNVSQQENSSSSNRSSAAESVFVSGGQVSKEETHSVGGAAGVEKNKNLADSEALGTISKKQLPASEISSDVSQQLKGRFENATGGPLFPLDPINQSTEGSRVKGVAPNSQDSKPVSNFDLTLDALSGLPQDPLMRELESLLQNKPELSLQPSIQDPLRHKKYDEYMKTIPIQELSSIKRRDAKLRLKDLIKDIDKPSLEDQDVLRREYVKALFKKEG